MQHSDTIERNMSANDFQMLGMNLVAYVKEIEGESTPHYAVYAANGMEIALMEADREVAFATVRQHDMEPVSVH